MSRTITTNGTVGIRLTNPSDNPVTVTAGGAVSTAGDYAIYGSAGVAWLLTNFGELSGAQYGVTIAGSATITNDGTIAATGSKSTGVMLGGGGRVVNGGAGFLAARISGSYIGVLIAGGVGTVANFGTITASDMPGSGAVALMQGGTVINGSTSLTAASISGGAAGAVYIIGGTSALVANQGTITGLGSAAGAVELWSGGTVVNGAPGNSAATIAAPQSGVYVTGGAGTVVNDGVIAGGPLPNNGYYLVPSWGVAMRAGGSVTNGSAARIDGSYRGVEIQGGAGTVVNSGTITAEHSNGRGINLPAGGTITNATTASVIAAGDYAIAVAGARGTVVNQGTITGATPDYYGLAKGVALMAGGVVTNGGPTNTAALISVSFGPVGISGGAGTVVNYGTIIDTGSFGSGMNLGSGGTVTNGPAALIHGYFYGVAIAGGAGTVVNSGTIVGHAEYGVVLNVGGSVTNALSGRIVGAVRGIDLASSSTGTLSNSGVVSGGVGIAMPSTSGVIMNAGTIIGTGGSAIDGSAGDDLLIIEPGAVFQGKVETYADGVHHNRMELAGTNPGVLNGIGTQFLGFDTFTFDNGAAWKLSGVPSAFSGTQVINGFASTDTIDLVGVSETIDGFAAGTLSLHGSQSLKLLLTGTFAAPFHAAADGSGGTNITLESPTSLAIKPLSALKYEGNSGSTPFTFTVTRSGLTTGASSSHWAVAGTDGAPASAADFAGGVLPSGTVSFAAGEASKTITVNVAGDTTVEPLEHFAVTLSAATGATITTATATGAIYNDDTALAIKPLSALKYEGNSGSTPFTFTVTRSGLLSGVSSAKWAVSGTDGAPANAADFTGAVLPSGTVSFAAGEHSKTVTVNVAGDTILEPLEHFAVTLSAPTGATITTAAADGAIYNDDTVLAIKPLSASKYEGNSGSTPFTFTVARSGLLKGASSAQWAVTGTDGAPADAADFSGGVLPSGTVSFAAGEASKTITVNVAGDTTVEPLEHFAVTLSAPTGATITTASATGAIYNDDSALAIKPLSASKKEGNSGSKPFTFTVTRSGLLSGASSAHWTVTGNDGAPANAADFTGGVLPSGTVSFAADENSKSITVNVAGDTTVEPDEQFAVTLSAPTGATITTASAVGTILNDDTVALASSPPGGMVFMVPNGGGGTGDVAAASGQSATATGYGIGLANALGAPDSCNLVPLETGSTVLPPYLSSFSPQYGAGSGELVAIGHSSIAGATFATVNAGDAGLLITHT